MSQQGFGLTNDRDCCASLVTDWPMKLQQTRFKIMHSQQFLLWPWRESCGGSGNTFFLKRYTAFEAKTDWQGLLQHFQRLSETFCATALGTVIGTWKASLKAVLLLSRHLVMLLKTAIFASSIVAASAQELPDPPQHSLSRPQWLFTWNSGTTSSWCRTSWCNLRDMGPLLWSIWDNYIGPPANVLTPMVAQSPCSIYTLRLLACVCVCLWSTCYSLFRPGSADRRQTLGYIYAESHGKHHNGVQVASLPRLAGCWYHFRCSLRRGRSLLLLVYIYNYIDIITNMKPYEYLKLKTI